MAVSLSKTLYKVTVYSGIEIIKCKQLNKMQLNDFIVSLNDTLGITYIDIEVIKEPIKTKEKDNA